MAVKVRADLLAVAERVRQEFGDGSVLISRPHIEAAIANYARATKEARPFTDAEYRLLLRLRSQAFKAPDKLLKIS